MARSRQRDEKFLTTFQFAISLDHFVKSTDQIKSFMHADYTVISSNVVLLIGTVRMPDFQPFCAPAFLLAVFLGGGSQTDSVKRLDFEVALYILQRCYVINRIGIEKVCITFGFV